MEFPEDQLSELKALFTNVAKCEEGGATFFLIPELAMPDGCQPTQVDALLCPSARDGYSSRLFFATEITSRTARNWNSKQVRIVDRNWFAYSWKVRPGLRLAQLVAAHLGALR